MEANPPHASSPSSTNGEPTHDVAAAVSVGALSLDSSPLAASPFDRARMLFQKDSLGRVDLHARRCLHCTVSDATTSFHDVARSGARFVGGVRATFIGLWLAFVGLFLVSERPRLSTGADLLELAAAVLSGWALFGLVFGGVLLGAHGLASHRIGLRIGLCHACATSAERAVSLRALFEVGSILGAALTVVGLCIFLSAPPPCACEEHSPGFVLLVVLPGLLLPISALGRLALGLVRYDREVHLAGVAPGHVRLDLPAPLAALLRREGRDAA